MSIETSNPEVLKIMGRFKHLRTLLITCSNQTIVDALNEMFKVTRSIRLLHINYRMTDVISENIEYLYHLRYLVFPILFVKLLPRSLSSLYLLQFLTINGLFPRDMNNLSNLCYLSSSEVLKFPGIGKLKLLQELKGFCIDNENGYRIEELEHINELCILEITNLENVKDAQEAWNAKLCDKSKLTDLSLNWGTTVFHYERGIADGDLNERVLDNLQPHNYLKTLQIFDYMGARSAIWMNEAHLINNLQEIQLFGCLEWKILPPFGQLPFLKTLLLHNMPKLK